MASLPTGRPVTPLRQRMLDDMALRSMRARTQHDYVRHIRAFAAFLGRSPDTATAEDVRRFQVHQREHGAGEAVIGGAVSALRFLFGVTLERPDLSRRLVLAPRPRKLPDVLSVEEVARLLEAAPGIKYRTALSVAYGAGLWRRADPRLPEDRRQVVVDELMDARRAGGRALRSDPTRRHCLRPAWRWTEPRRRWGNAGRSGGTTAHRT